MIRFSKTFGPNTVMFLGNLCTFFPFFLFLLSSIDSPPILSLEPEMIKKNPIPKEVSMLT